MKQPLTFTKKKGEKGEGIKLLVGKGIGVTALEKHFAICTILNICIPSKSTH